MAFCCRLIAVKLSRLIILLLLILVLVPLFTHYYLSKFVNDAPTAQKLQKGVQLDDLNSLKDSDLKVRIVEMVRIKTSVSSELRVLEATRQKLQAEISTLSQKVEQLKNEYARRQIDMERLQLSMQQAQYAQKEAQEKNIPHISAPKRILPSLEDQYYVPAPSNQGVRHCRMQLCFDYSRCSLTSGFPVYFYHPDDHRLSWNQLEKFVKMTVTEALNMNIHITFDPSIACVYVVLVGEIEDTKQLSNVQVERYLQSLGHWNGDGRNHVLLNFARSPNASDIFTGVNTGRAIIVQSHFTASQFRPNFDVIVPPLLGLPYGDIWEGLPPISPARRKFLLSYQGEYRTTIAHRATIPKSRNILSFNASSQNPSEWKMRSRLNIDTKIDDEEEYETSVSEEFVMENLKSIQALAQQDKLFLRFACTVEKLSCLDEEWCLCDSETARGQLLAESTFSLIIAPSSFNVVSTPQFQTRIFESVKYGAIPVVLGNQMILPYDNVIDWPQAILILPKARITELHFLLRTFTDADVLRMRSRGRLFWERYMSTSQEVVNSVLAVLRHRLQIPPPSVQEEQSPSVFNSTFQPIMVEVAAIQDAEAEENLGPLEPPMPSPHYQRNYTYSITQQYHMWNEAMDPFNLYPYTPYDPILPAEAKFIGSSFGFRPVGQGAGGAGKEFSESLGGNVPREQFTVVMLTYEREAVLIDSLQRLHGLPFLNKVIVVWNSPRLPSSDLRWPEIGVPIQVVKAKKNSLNNRFLPFDTIETEAVLSMDDDAHLRHDEIVFSFRVWREARERIVGLPGRYHAWDLKFGNWLYNSNYSCELSMVLTGAAFFHKYYAYLYSTWMPQAIRDKVDEYMNCEDIAMNFLVAHVTRKPPIKVTSRWTFRCPGCPVALSEEDSHFQERHKCINFFAQVYGYMPLLNTQFRADSVLFKTRIPHDKQKCFKFI